MKKSLVIALLTLLALVSKGQCIDQDGFNKDKWHIGFFSPGKQKVLLEVADSTGAVVYSNKVRVYKGYNTPTVYMDKFKAGTYKLSIKDLFTLLITKHP